jgi:methyltransferase (TIGR00027 family)
MRGVALTSLWVAAWRADESERPDALFHDPHARALAGPEGFELLEAARDVAVIEAPFVPVRTVFFDQRIVRGSQVVLLGAGMDTRAFRLQWPRGARVFEVDLPELLVLKEQRLGGVTPRCIRITVPTDLTGDWVAALERRGFRPELPSVWLLEGLLLYLDESVVRSVLARVDALSAAGSTVLADVIGWTMLWMPQLQPLHDFVRELGAPWKFGTDEPEELLEPLGWEVSAYDLGTVAAEVGRWAWPVIPRAIPGVPRSFLVEAVKLPREVRRTSEPSGASSGARDRAVLPILTAVGVDGLLARRRLRPLRRAVSSSPEQESALPAADRPGPPCLRTGLVWPPSR